MNELIEWLKVGIYEGHITSDEAFQWVAKKSDEVAPSRLRPVSPDKDDDVSKGPRLKKDGTPWGKRGSRKNPELPNLGGDK